VKGKREQSKNKRILFNKKIISKQESAKLRKAGLEPTEPAPKADMLPITSFSEWRHFFISNAFVLLPL
jgi:hypothetical protein